MKFNMQQAFRALILLSFSAFLFKINFTSEITMFVNPKYVGLSQTASVLFLFLFFIQITRVWTEKKERQSCNHNHIHDDHCSHDHGDKPFTFKKFISYGIIVFPLITGFVLPAKIMDASIAEKKGGMAILANNKESASSSDIAKNNSKEPTIESDNTEDYSINETDETGISEEENLDIDNAPDPNLTNQPEISKDELNELIRKLEKSTTIDMNDYVYSTYYEEISKDLAKYEGREIELKGFVYKEEGIPNNQLVIARFLITHCVADASIIGFLSEFAEAESIQTDTWLEAKGVLEITTYNGIELPLVKITAWKVIDQPKEPYLYPINVRIL
ncbi:TIGR03943 family protein [Bacillus sp. HMF5848]|uniref:TIGR03943 family putative permease subunit n=1 Tax=Bacillus sp. HMF5848 TaxID=2495421 RepID=UPI000F780CE4|nr:TIGR03943 family protein [Bacillus sp. HMF5848]RSK26179.1 TIGR03943 family protein [Bacillus sp. HMF5848]